MSAHVLLHLNKRVDAKLCRAFYHFLATLLIKSIVYEQDYKILFINIYHII